MTIGYVCNRYPAVSNTFILGEVRALRAMGAELATFSVRRPADADVLARADREELERTSYLLPAAPGELLRAHLRGLLRRPRRYLSTLARALRLAPPGPRGLVWQLLYFGEAILLWDRCRRLGISHLHAHFAYVASDDALLAAHMGGWTWSFSMHGPPEFADVRGTRLAEKVADADAVVCISDFCRSQLMSLVDEEHWAKLHVVRCGIDVRAFAPPSTNGAAPAPRPVVLMVARMAAVKGHAVLLEAVAQLRDRGVDLDVVLVGDGPHRAAVERTVAALGLGDRVRLLGAVGQDDIRAQYAHADVFCLPSFAEGLPVVLMEAMATGVAVVASRIMGVPELVEDGVGGLLTTPGRADELAAALERLAGDAPLRARLAAAGREKVRANHDIAVNTVALRGVFDEVAA